ncbi:MAG: hypothetical protein IKU73_07235 [Clostridia bacterium]|nr:hypothetical protein [Clostridia bacterium]
MAEYAAPRQCVRLAACGFFPEHGCAIPRRKACKRRLFSFPLENGVEKTQAFPQEKGQHLTAENSRKRFLLLQKEKD